MKIWVLFLTSIVVALIASPLNSKQAPPLIRPGDTFPDLLLNEPRTPRDINYLGLKKNHPFALKQIQAEVILVEILSVYCPACQRQTPFFNNLFKKIESNKDTQNKVKIIGVAAGNNYNEIENFKKNYDVSFPIIPDPQFKLHYAIGGSRTPFTMIVRKAPQESDSLVAYTHLGPLENENQLLAAIQNIMQMEIASIRELATKQKQTSTTINPIHTEEELLDHVHLAFKRINPSAQNIQKIELQEAKRLYRCTVSEKGEVRRLYANVIARPPVCSDCHDIHFLYVFDSSGVILEFVSLQLTKWGNEPWDAADITKMKGRLIGKSLRSPLIFNPTLDAVSSATITSAMIFDSLSQGNHLLKALQVNGWL